MTAQQLLRQLADRGIRFVLHRNRVSLQFTKPTIYALPRTQTQRVTPEEQAELHRLKDEVFDLVLRGRWGASSTL